MSGIFYFFLKATQVAKSLLFSVTESLTSITELNACHDKSIHSFLTCSVCLLMMGQSICGALERSTASKDFSSLQTSFFMHSMSGEHSGF